MLEFSSYIQPLTFDAKRMKRTFDKLMGRTIREGARRWLRAWLEEGVPVETGMALGALQPLGRFLRVSLSNNAYGTSPTRKPYYNTTEGVMSTPEAGARGSHFRLQDDSNNHGSFIYEFEWSTEVLHYYLSQFYRGQATPGENAILQAEQAMIEYVEDRIRTNFPDLNDYLSFATKV